MLRGRPAEGAGAFLRGLAALGALCALVAGAGAGVSAPEELMLLRPRPPPLPPEGVGEWAAPGFVVAHFAHVQGGGSGAGDATGGSGEGTAGLGGRKPLPRALRHLAAVGGLQELRLTLGRGRWNSELWGAAPGSSRELPQPGAELWVEFTPDTSAPEAEAAWRVLAEAVGGLLCTSLGTLRGQSVAPAKVWAGQVGGRARGPTRHGVLVGEPLCTENLSPWLALLPCGDLRGLGALLQRPKTAQADFMALGLSLRVGEGGGGVSGERTVEARQWATLAMRAGKWDPEKNWVWDLNDVFGAQAAEACPYCAASKVLVELPTSPVSDGVRTTPGPSGTKVQAATSADISETELPAARHLEYQLQPEGLTLQQAWPPQSLPLPGSAVLHGAAMEISSGLTASQVLMGSGNHHAGIFYEVSVGHKLPAGARVCMFQVVPWHTHLWLHTLRITRSGEVLPVHEAMESLEVAFPEERDRPGHWMMCFREAPTPTSIQMEIEFDKAFITVEECTPDISRGLDIPAAVFSLLSATGSDMGTSSTLESESLALRPSTVATEQLLMTVAHPDMSMPFNVVSFTSTALVLCLGVVTRAIVRTADGGGGEVDSNKRRRVARAALFVIFIASTVAIGLYIDREAREQFGGFLRAHGLPLADLLAPL